MKTTSVGGVITLDLHGMNVFQARVAIDRALRTATGASYMLRLVHGCNYGTALRDMIRGSYSRHPRVKAVRPGANDGITELIIGEL